MTSTISFPGLGIGEFTINRTAFTIFGINVQWYGLILTTGILVAFILFYRRAIKTERLTEDDVLNVTLLTVPISIIGARIVYVLTTWSDGKYKTFYDVIAIWEGGIAIYGAVLGAFIFGGLAAKWRKVPLLPLFDLVSLGFLIGQGVGRWGNFVNQEAFGTNTTLPWGMYSEGTEAYLRSVQVTLPAGMTVDPTAPVHPTFLYESIWCLVGFLALAAFFKKRRFNGQIFLGYVIWYGLGRAWIEGLRTDSLWLIPGVIRVSQLLGAVSFAIAAALLIFFCIKFRKRTPILESHPIAVADNTEKE